MKVMRDMVPGLVAPGGPAPAVPPWADVAGRRERAWARLPEFVFVSMLVIGVLPIWLVAHVPTQDGGNHVESVMALLRLPHSALLQRYYDPNYGLQPNWLTQIVLAGLVQLMSPRVAEKLILSGYLVLLPIAFRAALPRTSRGRWAALAIFPFVHSYTFHMGFWNFTYSLVLFFVVLGYWWRTRGRLDRRRGLVLTGMMLLLYFAHSVSTVAVLLAMTSMLGWRAGLGFLHTRERPARRRRLLWAASRRAVATYLYALPTITMLGAFVVHQRKPYTARPTLLAYIKYFVSLYQLVSFDRRELLITGAIAVLVAATVFVTWRERTSRRLRPVDGWLAAALVATALYFATPDSAADGAQLTDRLGLYPWFAALLWLGYTSAPVRRIKRLALALVVLFLAGTAVRVAKYRQIGPYLADYESVAPHIAEGSTILPITFAPYGPRQGGTSYGKKLLSYRVEAFQHVSGYVATDRHGIDLNNSQANTMHTPLRWKHEVNPFTYMDTEPFGMESEPPCIELWPYRALGGRIDDVIVWGLTPEVATRTRCGAAIASELAASYRRVYVSPLGMLQLFRPVQGGDRETPQATGEAARGGE